MLGLVARAHLPLRSVSTTLKSSLLKSLGKVGSGEMVSLFLEEWELARVALSRHLALDFLCQELQEACLGSPLRRCVEVSPTLKGL